MIADFTYLELATCARREVGQRARVYPRLVENKRMTQQQADRETRMMQAIAEYLEIEAVKEKLL